MTPSEAAGPAAAPVLSPAPHATINARSLYFFSTSRLNPTVAKRGVNLLTFIPPTVRARVVFATGLRKRLAPRIRRAARPPPDRTLLRDLYPFIYYLQ
ncbi:MAG: hypothetical protein [Cressdnaviricota sp.]|nr:MAG: hypothetical protein [Cressdnaviricota sp.]